MASRSRSSTMTARHLEGDEHNTPTAHLVERLKFIDNADLRSFSLHIPDVAADLERDLTNNGSGKDIFRHARGFELILEDMELTTRSDIDIVDKCATLCALLSVLKIAIYKHRKNQGFFRHFLHGWKRLHKALESEIAAQLHDHKSQTTVKALKTLFGRLWSAALWPEESSPLNNNGAREPTKDTEPMWSSPSKNTELHCPMFAVIATRLAIQCLRLSTHGDVIVLASNVLHAIAAATEASVRIASRLSECGLLPDLVLAISDGSLTLDTGRPVHALAHALSRFGFPHLSDAALLIKQACESQPARELLFSVLKSSKQPFFMHFDLTLFGFASIEFPCMSHTFPPQAGYSLATWLRFDEFDSTCHTTIFGAFDQSQVCFNLLYIEKDSQHLILQTSIHSSRPSVRFKSTRFVSGKWYHLVLVHKRNQADSQHSSALLFVDGEFKEKMKCAYPEAPIEHDDPAMGTSFATSPPPKNQRPKPVQAFFGTPRDLAVQLGRDKVMSKWSLASAQLYSAPLVDEYIAVQYYLGPRYVGNMQDCLGPMLTYTASAELNRYNELLHPEKSERSDIITATEGRGSDLVPEHKIAINVSATAIIRFDQDFDEEKDIHVRHALNSRAQFRYQQLSRQGHAVAINCAVAQLNEAFCRPYGIGVLTGEPLIVVPEGLDNASWSLTGSLALLVRLVDSTDSREAFVESVRIFFECVKDNWRVSEAMEKGHGFGVLATLIREKLGFEVGTAPVSRRKAATALPPSEIYTAQKELLELVLDFVGHRKTRPDNSMIVNPMAYRVLLLDFDTWRRCDLETQILYYQQFLHFLSNNRHQSFNHKRLTRMRAGRKLIEALKMDSFSEDVIPYFLAALRVLLDHASSGTLFRELAMFVTFGLHDARVSHSKPVRSLGNVVNIRQMATRWANKSLQRQQSAVHTNTSSPPRTATLADMAVHVLRLICDMIDSDTSLSTVKRFCKAVPNRWILHLLAEHDARVVQLALQILSRMLYGLGPDFKSSFIDKNGGFTTLKTRIKSYWRLPAVWEISFSLFFGHPRPLRSPDATFSLFYLVSTFKVDDNPAIKNPEMLPVLMSLLESGLRSIVQTDHPEESEVEILKTVVQFLNELYNRSAAFRDFAANSRYVQEIIFVLFPILVGSDRLSAEMELHSDSTSLTFKGEEVKMRPHSNSLGERPPSIRSLSNIKDEHRPSSRASIRVAAPQRLSSFVLVKTGADGGMEHARFKSLMGPKPTESINIKIGNSIIEALLEVVVNIFLDSICKMDRFNGIGLFLKVPPGFREHQAYFESYVLVHTLAQLWNHFQLHQSLFIETRVITNLSRFCMHMAEAVFEGWFVDGAQPLLDFAGKVLEYFQQPKIAAIKDVRLCSQNINMIRIVFLRVCLWRLSELDEARSEEEATAFLSKMNYWQTILFSSDNQEFVFVRLICFLLFLKLISPFKPVRKASVTLWRTIMVQKPTETATLLTFVMGSEHRHLSTNFMKLISMDDDDFIAWVDDNRESLDKVFIGALNKPWEDFVADETRQTEESAQNRLSKRKDRLRQWQIEEAASDDLIYRYEVSTNHWRSNVHAQERLKLQRSIQDFQENVTHLLSVFEGIEKLITAPSGLEPTLEYKWQLDETEAVNRMRLRTVPSPAEREAVYLPKRKPSEHPSGKLAVNTQLGHTIKDNILSPVPPSSALTDGDGNHDGVENTPGRDRSASASNSQLLEGAFEMVEDPREADDGLPEDKNRKVMTSLQRGDVVQQLYNVSRIIGLEACEGLLVLGKKCLYMQDNFFQRSDGEIVSAAQAPEDERDPYVQLISGKDVGIQSMKLSIGDQETRHWAWSEVLSISKRRFLFRDVAVEVFFTDGRSYLLTCMSSKVRDDLYAAIVSRAPHVHSSSAIASEDAWRLETLRNPEETPQSFGSKFASVFNTSLTYTATKRWAKGEMSNFQYLMLVNTMAGRSFNDLTQYPIFPWVLADYSSEELDLSDRKTFRNLSKPMGCQTKTREAEYKDRYKQFAEMDDHNAPFHYGTHYSSAMIVSSYLIRLQPFVQSYLLLQGGSFDHADRLFDSIENAWLSASRDNMSDVRELTPEFFYLPEFLININEYEFGSKQTGDEVVNDVKLPPWAHNDPHVFIAKNREALESPYVSEHLHQWIDLVFGFKQRGEAAVEATNVFQHLSYQGAKDLDSIHDPVERLASIGIIHSFGQTPYQVFQKAHPAREQHRATTPRLDSLIETLVKLPDPLLESDEKVVGLTFPANQERLLCTGPCKLNLLPNYDSYLQWGFTDNSLRFFSANSKRSLGLYEQLHVGPITMATIPDSKTLVTAGPDCTIGLWGISSSRDAITVQPKTYLFGHRSPVVILAASRVYSTLLSASTDGNILIWSLNRYQSIRVLRPAGNPAIRAARISNVSGHMLICEDQHVLLYTLNGHLLLKQRVSESDQDHLSCCAFYEGAANEWLERELIFTGHAGGVANVWTLTTLANGNWHLLLVKRMVHGNGPTNTREAARTTVAPAAAITAILPTPHAVYTGDENGRVWEWDCVLRHGGSGTRVR